MDTSTYIAELLGTFDADMSALSDQTSSSGGSGGSPDRSNDDINDLSAGDSSLFQSPPIKHSRRAAALSPPLVSPIAASGAGAASAAASSSAVAAASSAAAARQQASVAARLEEASDLSLRYSQLKKNFRKQSEELEKTTKELDADKRAASRERMELEERVRAAEHKHALLESQYQKAQLEFNHVLAVKQQELSSTVSELRKSQAALLDHNPDVLKQIEHVKDDLTDLTLSEPLYLEYKGIEPNRQTIRQYVCCQVYELVRSERAAREAMLKELELVRAKSITTEDQADRNARERDQIARLKKTRETELLGEVTHLETLNSKLHDELTKKTLLVQELSSKGELYDVLSSRASKLEDEVSQLRQKDLVQSLTLKSLQEERENLTSRVANLDQAQDMLRMDKMYLTKETERLSDCYRDARQSIERLEVKNGELKRQKDELVDKLVKVREEHQQSYEEKLSAELNRLQSRTTADLESIRRTQKEAFEREISGLKEAREHAIAEAERQRTAAESTREDLTALQEEHRRLQSTLETERSDSRNALKLKSFEHDRLSLTYEECLSDLRKLKIEHEVLGKKCSLVKQELFTLQSDSQKSINDLENQNKNLTEKLSMYQQLEYELDMAILGAGGLAADGGEDGAAGGSGPVGAKAGVRGIHAILESLGSNIPTANKRRMKQSILLAQQLVEKQKQIDVLTKELAHYKERNNELDAELDASRRALACTSQPHSYLITALQAKESDLASATRALEQAQHRLAEREKELARAIDAKAAVEADMHKLLAGRQAVDGIKQALMREQGRHGAALQQLDQQFAAQQAGGACQAVTMSNFKENRQPQASSFGQPSPNDPRNFSPYNIGGGGGLLAQSQPQQQQYPQQHQFASSGSSLSSSQGRPTSSFATHNKSLAGDAALDAQPKPLWFRKLAQ